MRRRDKEFFERHGDSGRVNIPETRDGGFIAPVDQRQAFNKQNIPEKTGVTSDEYPKATSVYPALPLFSKRFRIQQFDEQPAISATRREFFSYTIPAGYVFILRSVSVEGYFISGGSTDHEQPVSSVFDINVNEGGIPRQEINSYTELSPVYINELFMIFNERAIVSVTVEYTDVSADFSSDTIINGDLIPIKGDDFNLAVVEG
jgi:hypothetical protein